ncbi:MAG: hypothetical protein KDD67_18660 [Ignavibacteriae bacterium]|nr:hypothetical protein [Ignavibacteriota bacterium]MCB9217526.1 hypothetical protein [Ignavibacteria bacterium]
MLRNTILTASALIAVLTISSIAQPVSDDKGNVGIGTNDPDPSALLDLVSTTGGLLVPRMTSAQRDAIENPATGLLIFNIETGQFEYNSGSPGEPSWGAIGGGNDWHVAGNNATNPATNFLGTLDNQPVAFRTNNMERMRLTNNGLVPGADDTYDLGHPAARWRDLYLGPTSLHLYEIETDWTVSIDVGESPLFRSLLFSLNGTTHMAVGPGGTLNVPALGSAGRGGQSFIDQLVLSHPNGDIFAAEPGGVIDDFAWVLTGNSGTNSTTNFLGTTDDQALSIRTNNQGRLFITNDGNTLPGADNTYDLGTSTVRWQDIHLGPGSLHLHTTAAEADSAHDWSVGVVTAAGAGQGALQIAEDGNGVMTMNSQGNVGLGANAPTVRADINGGLAIRPPSTVSVTSGSTTTITVGNRSYIRVDSDDEPFVRPVTLSDGLQDGQVLVLHCIATCDVETETFDGVELENGNVLLRDNEPGYLMFGNFNITMIWDATQSSWIELSRTDIGCEEPE